MGLLMGGFAGRWYAPPPLDPEVEAEIRSRYMSLMANLETQNAQFTTQALATHGQLLVNARQSQANLYSVLGNLMQADASNRHAYSALLGSLEPVLEQTLMDAYGHVPQPVAKALGDTAVGMGETVRSAVMDPEASGAGGILEQAGMEAFNFGRFVADKNQGNARNNINQIIGSQRANGRPTIDAAITAEIALRNEMRSAALATEDALNMRRGTLSSEQALNTAMFSAGYAIPDGGSVLIGGNAMTREQVLENLDLDDTERERMANPLVSSLIHEAEATGTDSRDLKRQRFVTANQELETLRLRMQQGPASAEKSGVISAINQLQADIDEMSTDPTYMARRLGEMPSLSGIQDTQAQINSQLEYLSMSRDPVEQKINQLYGEFGREFMQSYAMVAFDGALHQPNVEDVMQDLQTEEGQKRLIMAKQLYDNASDLYANDPHLFWRRLQENGVPVNSIQRRTGLTPLALEVEANATNLRDDALLGTEENVRRNGRLMPSAYRAVLPALQEPGVEEEVVAAVDPEVPEEVAATAPTAEPVAPEVDLLAGEEEDADIRIPTGVREGMPEWYPPITEAHTLDIEGENYVLDSDGALSVIEEDGHIETISPTEDSALYGEIHQRFEAAAAEGQFTYQPPQSVEEVDERVRRGEFVSNEEIAAARGRTPAEEAAVDMPQVRATREEIMALDEPTLRERVAARREAREDRSEDPLLERAKAAMERTKERAREALLSREKKFEAPTKMRYQPAEEAAVKPPKPKRREAPESPARPVRPRRDEAPKREGGPTEPRRDAAAEHEAEVSSVVSDMTPEQIAEVDAAVARTDMAGAPDTPPGNRVSVDDAARRTVPTHGGGPGQPGRAPGGGQSGMFGRAE